MAQHDYDLANAIGASFRADANLALAAIVSQNSGTTAPTTTFAYMLWADTTSGFLKQRNAANSAWITLFRLSDMAMMDTTFAVVDDSDNTKKVVLQCSGITTGTTITITIPNASLTLAGIDVQQLFTANQRPNYKSAATASGGGSYTFDGGGASNNGQITLVTLTTAGTLTLAAPTNIVEGMPYTLILKAGDTNARTPSFNSAYKFPSATSPLTSLTTTSSAYDVINFIGGESNTLIYNGHQADVR